MFGIGAGEFALILIVGLIVFGPSKLPELGRSLGKLLREFKKAQAALTNVVNEVDQTSTKPTATTQSEAVVTVNQDLSQKSQVADQTLSLNEEIHKPTPSSTRIEQVTEMINSNPIKLNKEPVER